MTVRLGTSPQNWSKEHFATVRLQPRCSELDLGLTQPTFQLEVLLTFGHLWHLLAGGCRGSVLTGTFRLHNGLHAAISNCKV